DPVRRITQTLRELAEHLLRDRKILTEDVQEVAAPDRNELERLDGNDRGRARLVIEKRHLAEEIARCQDRQDDLFPLGRDHGDLHLSFADEVENVADLVGVKDGVILRIAPSFGDGGDRRELALIELREERELPVERRWEHWLRDFSSKARCYTPPRSPQREWPSNGSSRSLPAKAGSARRPSPSIS